MARLAPAVLLAVLALSAPALAQPVDGGVITVGRGPAGATLGMSRAQLIGALGRPLSENDNGVMSYQPADGGIFDVYRDGKHGPARLFIVSFPGSRGWTLGDGNHIFRRGAIRRLHRHYGARLHKRELADVGSKLFFVRGRFHGRKVETQFEVTSFSRAKARVLDVYVLFV